MREPPPPLDAGRIFATLRRHDVRFVVIGGIAAQAWGSPSLTGDLDICYERDPENLPRLAAALRELGARLRGPGVPPDLPFKIDPTTFELGDHFTLRTVAGDLDCLGTPAGTVGYRDVAAESTVIDLYGGPVRIVSLENLMRMKRAAGRAKDRAELEILGALRDELERRGALTIGPPGPMPAGPTKRRRPRGSRPKPPKRPRGRR
ncbi:MAG: hypothetical protein HYU87_10510 [Chloroflexi bacterium]|nr:hypothetical protein [Chloroflexota bacterium]